MTAEQLQARINELKALRERFELQAQMELASYNGAIQELERLLGVIQSTAPPPPP